MTKKPGPVQVRGKGDNADGHQIENELLLGLPPKERDILVPQLISFNSGRTRVSMNRANPSSSPGS